MVSNKDILFYIILNLTHMPLTPSLKKRRETSHTQELVEIRFESELFICDLDFKF